MNEYVVEVKNLVKKFGDVTAVNNISFSVMKGEIFGIIGANGAGKTTTIRMLCGILPPTSGIVRVSGFKIPRESHKVKSKIGYMSQKFSLYEDLTALENLELFAALYGVNNRDFHSEIERLNQFLEFKPFLNSLVSSLPLGWKQRIALSCALLHRPELIFLDEPTSGVDPVSRRSFWKIIRKLSGAGQTIIVTTHYMEEAEYCDRLTIMHEGRILALDSPDSLKTSLEKESMEEVFVSLVGGSIEEV